MKHWNGLKEGDWSINLIRHCAKLEQLEEVDGESDYLRHGLFENLLYSEIKKNNEACWVIVQNKNCSESLLTHCYETEKPRRHVLSNIAVHSNCSIELLEVLARATEYSVRRLALSNRNMPSELIDDLFMEQDDSDLLRVMLRHPNCPAHLLEQSLKSADVKLRIGVAENSALTPDLIDKVLMDTELNVRRALAENKCCPPSVLSALWGEGDLMNCSIVRNSNTPERILFEALNKVQSCGADSNHSVQSYAVALALNQNFPIAHLESIIPTYVGLGGFAYALIDRDDCSKETLAQLATSWNPNVPRLVVNHKLVTPEILESLSKTRDKSVKELILNHPKCPKSVLLRISKLKDKRLASLASHKLSLHPEH